MRSVSFTHRPLFWLGVAFGAGIIVLGGRPAFWPLLVGGLAVSSLVSAGVFFRLRFLSIVSLLLAVFCAGGLWYRQVSVFTPDHVSIWLERGKEACTLRGIVLSYVKEGSSGSVPRSTFTLQAQAVCRQGECRSAAGMVLVNIFVPVDFSVGDEVVLRGKLHRPGVFGSSARSSYQDILRNKGIEVCLSVKKADRPLLMRRASLWSLPAATQRMRLYFARIYERYLPPEEAGLMKAFMLGMRENIPAHVYRLFRDTGTAHIVAISGLNITLLVSIFVMLLGALRVGRRASFVLSLLLAWFYAFMVGGEPPVVRAAWMSTVFLLAFVIEREQDMLNTLGFALLAMALADPRQLFDVGFQLSFVCVLSIVLISPMFLLPWVGTQGDTSLLRWMTEGLIASLAAWAGSAGITAYVFGNLTPIGLLANLPVVPLATLVTALGVAVVIAGSLFVPLGALLAASLHISLNLLVAAAWFFSLVPGGVWVLPQVSSGIVCGYYILFLAGFGFIRYRYVATS